MRYIWREIIIRTVSDNIFNNIDDIKNIISNLKSRNISCSLRLKNSNLYKDVRFIKTEDDVFKFIILGKGSLEISSSYDNVDQLEVSASDPELAYHDDKKTKWSYLSPIDYEDKNEN